MSRKLVLIIVSCSIAISTLFYLSDIFFQLDKFNWQLWLKEVLFFLAIGLIGSLITFRHGKRWEKNSKE